MTITINPSTINGSITAPPSKSITHRALIIAALADGVSVIKNPLQSEDIDQTISGLKAFGVAIEKKGNEIAVHGTGGRLQAPEDPIHLGQSGTSLRLLTAVAALTDGKTVLTGDKRLTERPIGELLHGLRQMDRKTNCLEKEGFAPIEIAGGTIRGGKILINGSKSSQFVSALMLIAPFATEDIDYDVQITARNLASKPYTRVTMSTMAAFGANVTNDGDTFTICPSEKYNPQTYTVEGDYSSASYAFAAAAITDGKVSVESLQEKSYQGDKALLEILSKMGATVAFEADAVSVSGADRLKAIDVDLGDYPDIVQTLAVVAAFADGETTIRNIEQLRHKETDRIRALVNELKKAGVSIEATSDSLKIQGREPSGSDFQTHNDHRMAMCLTVLALGATGESTIENAEVVNKSYPGFFDDMRTLGARLEENV